MIKPLAPLLATFSLILVQSSFATAAIVVDLVPNKTEVGVLGGTVLVTVRMTGDENEFLTAYDLFVDIAGVDLNAAGTPPVTISDVQPLSLTSGVNFFVPEVPAGGSGDFGARGASFTNPESTTTGLDLFSFTANFAAQPDPTSFTFRFDPLASGSTINLGLGPIDLTTVSFNPVTIEVTSIPEPRLALLVPCIFAAMFLLSRDEKNSRRWRHHLAVN